MGLPKLKTKTSVAEYLESEKLSSVKREYVEGDVYAMAGASDNHARIAGNIFVALSIHLRNSKCEPFVDDIKVRASSKFYYYPNILVSCEENPDDAHFRSAPVLIVEVASPSTARIDRSEKLPYYLQMPGLRECIIVEREKMNVEIHRRAAVENWTTYCYDEPDDAAEFASIELDIPLTEIYRSVNLDT